MKFKFVQEIVKMFRCRKHEKLQPVPPQGVKVPVRQVVGETKSEIPASSRAQEAQVQPGAVAEDHAVPAQQVVPDFSAIDELCRKLPDDCHGIGSGIKSGRGCEPCEEATCLTCGPNKCRSAVELVVNVADELGLRYRVTVTVPPNIQESEYNDWLMKTHARLRDDAKKGTRCLCSYVCMFGMDAKRRPKLNLLTNADYRRGEDMAATMTCGSEERFGRTYGLLLDQGLVEFHELRDGELRDELMRMLLNMLELRVSGSKTLWGLSSSFDVGLSKAHGKVVRRMPLALAKRLSGSFEIPLLAGLS